MGNRCGSSSDLQDDSRFDNEIDGVVQMHREDSACVKKADPLNVSSSSHAGRESWASVSTTVSQPENLDTASGLGSSAETDTSAPRTLAEATSGECSLPPVLEIFEAQHKDEISSPVAASVPAAAGDRSCSAQAKATPADAAASVKGQIGKPDKEDTRIKEEEAQKKKTDKPSESPVAVSKAKANTENPKDEEKLPSKEQLLAPRRKSQTPDDSQKENKTPADQKVEQLKKEATDEKTAPLTSQALGERNEEYHLRTSKPGLGRGSSFRSTGTVSSASQSSVDEEQAKRRKDKITARREAAKKEQTKAQNLEKGKIEKEKEKPTKRNSASSMVLNMIVGR